MPPFCIVFYLFCTSFIFFVKFKSLPNVKFPLRAAYYSPPMPSSSAAFSRKSQLWKFVAASVSHIFSDFSTLKYHHNLIGSTKWTACLYCLHKLWESAAYTPAPLQIEHCFAALTSTRALHCLRTSSLTHRTPTDRTFRDVRVSFLLLVTRRANDNWRISAKNAQPATSNNNNTRNVLSISY